MHLLTTPLVTDAAGNKFGKSEGNAVWLGADLTSPYAFFQYWLNVEDASVLQLLRIFTDRDRAEIAALEQEVAERPFAREAQRTLARDVTALVHGREATEAVEAASRALFGQGELADLDERTLADAAAELPRASGGTGRPGRGRPAGGHGAGAEPLRRAPHRGGGRGVRQQRQGRGRRRRAHRVRPAARAVGAAAPRTAHPGGGRGDGVTGATPHP